MPEIALRLDDVAHALFQLLRAGKAAVALALPDERLADADLEIAAGAGNERHFAERIGEGRQKLLGHPARAEQPVALSAIQYGNTRLLPGHADLLRRSAQHIAAGRAWHAVHGDRSRKCHLILSSFVTGHLAAADSIAERYCNATFRQEPP
jgi:hypothetical protein